MVYNWRNPIGGPFQAYRMEAAQTSTSATSSAASSVDGRSGGTGGADYLNLGMFGQTSSVVGDLLLGPGSFGGSLGNGFGNDSGTSNTSSSVTGSSGATAFDLSDFPSLGGGTGSSVQASNGGLSAALRQQQQQLLAHQMLQGSNSKSTNMYRLAMSSGGNGGTNFNMATEDFPALPGVPSGSSGSNNGSAPSTSPLLLGATNTSSSAGAAGYVTSSVSRTSSSASGLYGTDLDNGSSQLDGSGLLGAAGFGGLQGSLSSGASTTIPVRPTTSSVISSGPVSLPSSTALGTAGSVAGTALSGDYGLLGLLGVIRMTDVDRNALALGSDLTMLGLNLGSSEQLYSTFSSPWSEAAATKEPHYKLPMCYYMQPPALKTGHLSKFQLETLFYIFYALPKDVLQAYAAQELYSREWRYHADLKLWFKRAGPADGIAGSSTSALQYLYFDITSWERRLFNGNLSQNIANGFLSDEDVRVKFPNS